MPQPALVSWPGAWTKQLLVVREPEKPELLMLQPSLVWRAMWLLVWSLTPSMISISPLLGQLGPTSQLYNVGVRIRISQHWVGRENLQGRPSAADTTRHVVKV